MLYEAVVASRSDTCEAILRRLDGYIISQVHRLGRCYSRDIHLAMLDLELDEIIQRVRIKLWQALEKRDIRYPYAYIKLISLDLSKRNDPGSIGPAAPATKCYDLLIKGARRRPQATDRGF